MNLTAPLFCLKKGMFLYKAMGNFPPRHPILLPRMSLFEYPVTRPIRFGRWSQVLFWLIAVLYITLITIINVISVGYEYVQVISSTYNTTEPLWYEHLPLAGSFLASSLICTPAQISWNEGTNFRNPTFGTIGKLT